MSIALVLGAGQAQRQAPEPARPSGPPSTLAGTLLDPRGNPIANAHLQLTTLDLRPVRDVTTDAAGGFMMTLIDSGQYLVRFLARDHAVDLEHVRLQGGRTVRVALRKGVVIQGRVVDERREPVGGVPVCGLRQVSAANAAPSYRSTAQTMTGADGRFLIHHPEALTGTYLVAAFPSGCLLDVPRQPLAARLARYPPSFAPAAHDSTRATPVQLDARTESPSVSITMTPGAVTNLTGRVAGYVNTTIVPGRVILEPPSGPVAIRRSARLSTEGRFDFPALPPGEYRLSVPPHADPVAPPAWSAATVIVKGAPTEQVTMHLQPTMSIAGSATFDGQPAPLYKVKVFSTISAVPSGGRTVPVDLLPTQFSAVDPDGQFLIKGLVPGEYRISAAGYVPLGWTVVSATLPAEPGEDPRPDALDVPFTIVPGKSLFGVRIVLTTRPGSIAGTVTTRDDKPAPRAMVLAFSTDSSYWRAGSRRIITAVAGEDGRFETSFVPDGEYFVVAGFEQVNLEDAATALVPIMTGATRVKVETGPPTRVVIRLNTSSEAGVTIR